MFSKHKESFSRRSWKALVIDVGAIIFSVLLALAVDDWRENRDIKDRVGRVQEIILQEVQANRASVAKALAYHEPLIEELVNGTHLILARSLAGQNVELNTEEQVKTVMSRMLASSPDMAFIDVNAKKIGEGNFYLQMGTRVVRLDISADSIKVYGDGNIQLRPAQISNSAWETAIATNTSIHMDYELVTAMTELTKMHEIHNTTVNKIIDILYGETGEIKSALQDLGWHEALLIEKYDNVELLLTR